MSRWPPQRRMRHRDAAGAVLDVMCRGYAGVGRSGPRLLISITEQVRRRVRRLTWEYGAADVRDIVKATNLACPYPHEVEAFVRAYARLWLRASRRTR